MKLTKLLLGSIFILSALVLASCHDVKDDSYPPALNKVNFELSTSQTRKDTLYTTDKKDFEIRGILLINKADYKRICDVNFSNKQQSKIEAGGVTFGEMKYTNGEVSLIKIYNWGTIERISTKAHKKAYAMTYTGKKPADIEVVLGVMGESAGISVSIK
ncbi:hypothetical protein [Prevotella nigrescens]|uniref:hypothetical protein n=1 Tax=Prevotella nigrescens TaxID=28133 RepID=UPI002880732A|nr:hypothetical protein [Prevotella nigrescens]